VRWLKVYEIPVASRQAKGKAVVNLLSIGNEETISAIVAVKEFNDEQSLIMATAQGTVKKTKLSAYSNPRKGGIIGITLDKGDDLIGVALIDGKQHVLLATKQGKSLRFLDADVRDLGRSARGVRGINLAKGDIVVGMIVFPPDVDKTGNTLLTCSSLGFAKRSKFEDYRLQSRGGKGIINLKCTPKNGTVAGVLVVHEDDEMMAVTKQGSIIRCNPADVRQTGRSAVGVRLVSLSSGDEVASVANVIARVDDEGEE
jgi:DNA gyrase subunit A